MSVSTPSKSEVCAIEIFIYGKDRVLSIEESALGIIFFNFLLFNCINIVTWNFVKFYSLEIKELFLTPECSNFWCTLKQEREQTGPCLEKLLITGVVITFMRCYPFPDPEDIFFASKMIFLETTIKLRVALASSMSFYALQVSPEQFFCAFAEKTGSLF